MSLLSRLAPLVPSPVRASTTPVPRPYLGPPLVQVDSDAGPLWIPAGDGVMLPFLQNKGTWEADEGQLLRSLMRPGAVFVDVGASFGYFSRYVAAHCAPSVVHAFEPHPVVSQVLALNAWHARPVVRVHTTALGSRNGTVAVATAEHNIGDTRVNESPGMEATMVAPVSRLDDLLAGRVDVMKIDVQGYETDVLMGAQDLLMVNPALSIVAEFWPTALRERELDPVEVLGNYEQMGLRVRLVRGADPVPASSTEILRFCDMAGPDGQANLLLGRH